MPTVGRKAPKGKEHTQSVVFWKDAGWTEASSRKWVKDHDYFTDGLDETENQFRWRQYDPDETEFIYRNQEIEKDSISLVLGIPKKDARDMKKNNSEPIRCFEGNTQPHEPFWTWLDMAEGEDPEMELYGYISEWSWFEDEITPKKFKDDLMKYGQGGPIKIRLNSYGGDVIAASMISSIMRDYPGKITVQIEGIAASAATTVAVSGSEVWIQDNAYFMIHDPSVVFFLAALNIEDLTRLADSLGSIKEGIINTYEIKTGLSRTRLSKLMTDETWMDAKKALDLGFVDKILTNPNNEIRIPIQNSAYVNALRNYSKVPATLMQELTQGDQPATLTSSGSMLTDEQQREARILRDQVNLILRKGEK